MIKNEKYNNLFSIWLISLIILITLIIIVGGLTRLTESGLSITKWEVFNGILPPLSPEQWERYFSDYQSIPQYTLLNSGMTLQEFKIIFFWEYFHRMLGRFVGLLFIIPFAFFMYKKILSHNLKLQLTFISLIILLQGLFGWYMVKSGLSDNTTVSHYRLSLHLFTAFVIFSSLIWILMNHTYKINKIFFQINRNFLFFKILLFLIFYK